MANRPQHSEKKIQLPTFNGPLDLLLHLIERNELDITGVSLSGVAEEYLAQVKHLKENAARIDNLMDFIVIGAQLVLIKSRALLPQTPVTIEGEEEEDPAEALARRLREYKQFKEMTRYLKGREDDELRTYLRVAQVPLKKTYGPVDMTGITVNTLYRAMQDALERAEALVDSVDVAKKPKVTIEGQISRVRQSIRHFGRFNFKSLLSNQVSRAELSVTLLAILECIKRREVVARQSYMFGPIEIVAMELIKEEQIGEEHVES